MTNRCVGDGTVYLSSDNWSTEFDASIPAVIEVLPGTTVIVETQCCSRGAVTERVSTNPDLFREELGWTPGMPVTGPIAVEGAQVGDTLVVEILDIKVVDQGWTMAAQGRPAIGNLLDTAESRILRVDGGSTLFEGRYRIALEPMIGTIGTTPEGEPIRSGWPGPHGGNMDCKDVKAGSTILLPVLVPGGNLAVGDLHAVQGDGEVGCAGMEIAGEVTLRLSLKRRSDLPVPLLEMDDRIAVIFTAETLYEAAVGAVERATSFLASHSDLSLADAGMLLSLVGDIRICQIVDPAMTCRMEVPRDLLQQVGIDVDDLWGAGDV